MLTANSIYKRYAGAEALRGISMVLRPGEITGLVGESGCGKTTLARILCGLTPPDSGAVSLAGCRPKKEFRRRVQMVFQDAGGALDPKATVAQALDEPLRNFGRLPRPLRAERALELLQAVGLEARLLPRYPHELSGGQRQRVVIARALAPNPEYLVCDEPVSSLDAGIRSQILELLRSLVQGRNAGCLLITHNLAVAAQICDRVSVMFAGKIVETLPAHRLADLAAHPYTRSLFIYAFELERCCCTETVPTAYSIAAQGCAYRRQCPHALPDCAAAQPPLLGNETHSVACYHPATKGHRHVHPA
ncbi:MAG: ABC transporter ATP-binding protein [Gracilibacteraceae bacterium]|jgi:ABC-type dipeptide/oligopeptide/nickel transport system ATPase subunit|nr:ABC transporter ATP-binding protein [Gracilibacteraceae bacterium]